jgi:enoyl-CoA hydratase
MSPISVHDPGTDKLLVDVDGGIARLTFNNPAKRNALSVEMRTALPVVLEGFESDPDVRVVVLAGAGERAFVSGADISEFGEQRTTPGARRDFDRLAADAGRAWAALSKPVIAMIRGYCIGGGLLTALQADIRVAAHDSRFGVPAARLGLGYAYRGVEALVALVGPAHAADILFSARQLDAAEAERIGLVNRVVPVADLEDEVMALARRITTNAPLTVTAIKAALRETQRPPERRDLARVAELVELCNRSADYREGQRAFLEKRSPRFAGH